MEALTDPAFRTIVAVGPGQCAKSEVAINWLAAAIDTDPADMLWYTQTDDIMRAFVKTRIDPLIEDHAVLRDRLGRGPSDDSLSFKRFRGMTVEFLAATRSTLITKRAGRIVADEWDAYDPALGDPKTLLDIRRQTFGANSKLLALSHCDRAAGLAEHKWTAGIMTLYRESDRRVGWWQCPECGAWSSPNPTAARVMVLEWPAEAPLDEIADAARLMCPVNGCVLDEQHRRQMILTLRWIGAGQTIAEDGTVEGALADREAAGFWIVGLMSGLIHGGIGGLARAHAKASRESEALGNDETLRQVVVKQWGIPYDPPRAIGQLDATTLADRAEPALELATVPQGVRFLTAAIDVQAGRFEVLVRGWGVDFESWVVDHFVRPAEPSVDPKAWDALLTDLLTRAWPLATDRSRGMCVRALGYDSAGEAGVTQQAYNAWKRLKAARLALRRGFVDGRDAWNVLPLKGASTRNAAVLTVAYPDSQRKDRRAYAGGQIPVGLFNANWWKDALAGQLARANPGPLAVHIPASLRSAEPPHAWFEQLVAEDRNHAGVWENKRGARNENLDLMVMTAVMARLHAAARMDWSRPPAWAAAWESNSMVRGSVTTAPAHPAPAEAVVGAPIAALPAPIRSLVRSLGAMLP